VVLLPLDEPLPGLGRRLGSGGGAGRFAVASLDTFRGKGGAAIHPRLEHLPVHLAPPDGVKGVRLLLTRRPTALLLPPVLAVFID
jgi:hypothetical protein